MSMPSTPTRVFAANWKMFKDPAEAGRFFAHFLGMHSPRPDAEVVFFPPAISLAAARAAAAGRDDLQFGVQNVHWEEQGAFTGETSPESAAAAGARWTLVGHSERRQLFGETDAECVRKAAAALRAGLRPVVCVGETLDQRRSGDAEGVVARQLAPVLDAVGPAGAARLALAYEPVWAIGTGETASPDDARAMHAAIRAQLAAAWGEAVAAAVPILYGGSVKPGNAAELLAQANVDGVLVGGASLDPGDWAAICAAAR